MYLLWFVPYLIVCIALSRVLGKRIQPAWAGWTATAALAAILLVLPLADEIIGSFQFASLCEQAREVKVHATISVGDEVLYTPEGKWRLGITDGTYEERWQTRVRAERALQYYIRSENRPVPLARSAIDISGREIRMFNASTGQPLAEWRQFSTKGGWISRRFDKPLLVQPQCAPRPVLERTVAQLVLPFNPPVSSSLPSSSLPSNSR